MKKKPQEEKGYCKCISSEIWSSGSIYGLGFIVAGVYFISIANSFWAGVLGLLKAIV